VENFGECPNRDQEVDCVPAAKIKVIPLREPELLLGFAVSTQTVNRSVLEIIKQLPTAISNMTRKALTIEQEGCGRNRTSRDEIDDVYTKTNVRNWCCG
jgi:hypothetical protein